MPLQVSTRHDVTIMYFTIQKNRQMLPSKIRIRFVQERAFAHFACGPIALRSALNRVSTARHDRSSFAAISCHALPSDTISMIVRSSAGV